HKLFCIASDGSLDWTYLSMMDLQSTPAVDRDGYIYIGRQGMKSLNPGGTLRWAHTVPGYNTDSSPAIGPDGSVYIEVGNRLYKFKEADVELSGGDVDPDQGHGYSNYRFDVNYESTAAPYIINVYIDGSPFRMTLKDGDANDGLYRYQATGLAEGSHEFYFYAESPTGRWDRAPDSGTYDGPLIDDTAPESETDSPTYRSSGDIPVDFEASDQGSGVDTVFLYYAYEGGGWTEFYSTTAATGAFGFTPADGDGDYHFCSLATDGVGNSEHYPPD
ncbi:unnamed protein product, partial [marine sediment metagenome]